MTREQDAGKTRRARTQLLLVALLFLLPVVLATYLYVSGWRPEGKSLQSGEMLQPARPLADATLMDAQGNPVQFSALRGKWVLVYFGRLPCAAACQNNLYKMQQVRLAQGRDAWRVQRVFISLDRADDAGVNTLTGQYPGLTVFRGEPAAIHALARDFQTRQGTALDNLERIYIVDPHGNLVLSYARDGDATGMRKDLARLLRLSQIG
jgi:cytochrome oxidase Cu insertion factor (SCO1/SenC/PrrC family)